MNIRKTPEEFRIDTLGTLLIGTEIRAYVFEFAPLSNVAPPGVLLQATNTVQITEDGEIVGVLADCWDAAATAALDFHTSFQLYNINANVGISKAAKQNQTGSDFIRFRAWNQAGNQMGFSMFPGNKVKAMDEIRVSVRLEADMPAGVSGVNASIVLLTRENALMREKR